MIPYIRSEFESLMKALASEVLVNTRSKYKNHVNTPDIQFRKELLEKISIIDAILKERGWVDPEPPKTKPKSAK